MIRRCVLKRFNAEVHSQSALEAVTEIRQMKDFSLQGIEKIDVTTFLTCYHIIGSGTYGDRKRVDTKEQADHSLFYLAAVALLDGEVYPMQLEPERIRRKDVQELLQKVDVHTQFPLHKPIKLAGLLDPYTEAYPDKMKTAVEIQYADGRTLSCKKDDYYGFFTRPLSWEDSMQKFRRLVSGVIDDERQQKIIDAVGNLENQDMQPLIDLLCIRDIPARKEEQAGTKEKQATR